MAPIINNTSKYPINILLVTLAASMLLTGCGSGKHSKNPGQGEITTEPVTLTSREDVLQYVTGQTYYLDANTGDDATGDGSSEKPWKTLAKSQSSVPQNSVVVLRAGNYGEFTDDAYAADRASWTVYINEQGAAPVISDIYMQHSVGPMDLRLVFYGITFRPGYVDPGPTDPHDPESGLEGHTYNGSKRCVQIEYRNHIEFYSCTMTGYTKHLTPDACYINFCDNIRIERCEMTLANRLITFTGCNRMTIAYNYLHNSDASFINDGNTGPYPSSDIVIEGNHCHDMNWNYDQDYCPRAEGYTPHGSLIALESPNVVIRNNVLHDGGATAGITFYADGTTVFSNILIENNLVYDVHNSYALDLSDVGENVIVRNNTISARGRYGMTNEYKYYIAMQHSGNYAGYSGGLSVYNNVFIGAVVYTTGISDVSEGNNIYWCVSPSGTFTSLYAEDDLNNSMIMMGTDDGRFDSGFFIGDFDRSWLYWNVDETIWHQYTLSSPGHGRVLDLRPATGSEAVNFGDPDRQSVDSLGSFDAAKAFINPDGVARDSGHHSAGCYEAD